MLPIFLHLPFTDLKFCCHINFLLYWLILRSLNNYQRNARTPHSTCIPLPLNEGLVDGYGTYCVNHVCCYTVVSGQQLLLLLILLAGELVPLVQGYWQVLSPTRKETSYSDSRFWLSYILFIIIIGGILVLYICMYVYNKTSIKRNILTIKQNTWGSRSGLSALLYLYSWNGFACRDVVRSYFSSNSTRSMGMFRSRKIGLGTSNIPYFFQVMTLVMSHNAYEHYFPIVGEHICTFTTAMK